MLRVLSVALVIGCMAALPALAQDANQSSLKDSTPQVNASGGGITLRSPGKWVRAAIARHNQLMGLRLNGPRFGQPNEEEGAIRAAGGSGSASTSSSGLNGIMGLINQLGSSGSLGGVIESLTGTPASGSTPNVATLNSGGSSSGGMDPRLAGLLALAEANRKSSGSQTRTDQNAESKSVLKTSTTQVRNGRTFGGAIARLPKADQRYQEAVDQPKFATRWANAMMQTFFTTLTVGLQSRSFIDRIKDGLRPLILPPADSGSGSGDGSSGGGDSGDGSSGGGSSGGDSSDSGIEDLPPPSGGTGGDTGSI